MTQELRVRVAQIFCADKNGPWPECVCSTKEALDCPECLMHADAAIALALEEAARVADAAAMVHGSGYSIDDIRDVAAAIRALGKGK